MCSLSRFGFGAAPTKPRVVTLSRADGTLLHTVNLTGDGLNTTIGQRWTLKDGATEFFSAATDFVARPCRTSSTTTTPNENVRTTFTVQTTTTNANLSSTSTTITSQTSGVVVNAAPSRAALIGGIVGGVALLLLLLLLLVCYYVARSRRNTTNDQSSSAAANVVMTPHAVSKSDPLYVDITIVEKPSSTNSTTTSDTATNYQVPEFNANLEQVEMRRNFNSS